MYVCLSVCLSACMHVLCMYVYIFIYVCKSTYVYVEPSCDSFFCKQWMIGWQPTIHSQVFFSQPLSHQPMGGSNWTKVLKNMLGWQTDRICSGCWGDISKWSCYFRWSRKSWKTQSSHLGRWRNWPDVQWQTGPQIELWQGEKSMTFAKACRGSCWVCPLHQDFQSVSSVAGWWSFSPRTIRIFHVTKSWLSLHSSISWLQTSQWLLHHSPFPKSPSFRFSPPEIVLLPCHVGCVGWASAGNRGTSVQSHGYRSSRTTCQRSRTLGGQGCAYYGCDCGKWGKHGDLYDSGLIWMIMDDCGWLWMVMDCSGWLWMIKSIPSGMVI